MTGPEHYQAAARLLENAGDDWTEEGKAQVHATLALVATQIKVTHPTLSPSWSDALASATKTADVRA